MATNLVAKMRQNYLPPALIALLFGSGIRYRYRNVRVNSANDASNFVKFGPITSELTGLICERLIRHGQKKLANLVEYHRTYWTDFRNLFHRMKALYVQMMDLYLIFQFFKGRFHGNQIILPL